MTPPLELQVAVRVALDPEPDERGNLTTAAVVDGGRMIALTLNAN
jgi:hypothetical protein